MSSLNHSTLANFLIAKVSASNFAKILYFLKKVELRTDNLDKSWHRNIDNNERLRLNLEWETRAIGRPPNSIPSFSFVMLPR